VQLPIHNSKGEVVGQAEVADVLFGGPVNRPLLHQVLVAQLGNHRAGTHSTKTRAEVSGGGRKPRPQKYTGRSRQGSIRSPQWKGGGIVFGPRPRSHLRDIPKKMRRLALRSALSSRVGSSEVILLESLAFAAPKTQELRIALQNVGAHRSTLVVIGEPTRTLALSARNLTRVRVLPADRLNVEDVLRYHRIVMTVDAVRKAEELWARPLMKREVGLLGAAVTAPEAEAEDAAATEDRAEVVAQPEAAIAASVDDAAAATEDDADATAGASVEAPLEVEAGSEPAPAASSEEAAEDGQPEDKE
jgi:large subunit ribosomal protein L4